MVAWFVTPLLAVVVALKISSPLLAVELKGALYCKVLLVILKMHLWCFYTKSSDVSLIPTFSKSTLKSGVGLFFTYYWVPIIYRIPVRSLSNPQMPIILFAAMIDKWE